MGLCTIEWSESHHAGDDVAFIRSHLDAGGDEGPLIVIPYSSNARPRGPKHAAQIFENLDRYISHLIHHVDELDDERWVGLVREISRDQKEAVLAALYDLAQVVAPPLRTFRSPTGNKTTEKAADYSVLKGPFSSETEIAFVHTGGVLPDLLARFPNIIRPNDLKSDDLLQDL